jgi:hypothetical protein
MVNVFANFIDLTGTITNGFVIFHLRNFFGFIPVVPSTGIFALTTLKTPLGTSFSVNIEPNDAIVPNSTYYLVQVYDSTGILVSEASYQFVAAQSSVDLSLYSPINTTSNPALPPAGTSPLEIFVIRAKGLTDNYNAGVTVSMVTPTTDTMFRISAYEAMDVPSPGSGSSTLPSLTLNYTDAGGIARSLVLIPTDTFNNVNTSIGWNVAPFYAKGGVPITITSAGYSASPTAAMQYELAVTLENMF